MATISFTIPDDDYVTKLNYFAPVEGTWTPTLVGTTTAGAATYVTRVGNYTKFGRMVHVNLDISISAHTGTGNMEITGLPFTSGAIHAPLVFRSDNLTIGNKQGSTYVSAGTTKIVLETLVTGAAAAAMPMDTVFAAQISGWYMT